MALQQQQQQFIPFFKKNDIPNIDRPRLALLVDVGCQK